MYKSLTIIIFFAIFAASTLVAEGPYNQNNSDLNIGIGLGSTLVGSMTIPPISASYEVGITDKISAGGYLGFAATEDKWGWGSDDWTWKYTNIIIGARGSYHFYNEDKIDAYGGLMLGYNIVSVTTPSAYHGGSYSASGSEFVYSIHGGGKYYFSDSFGAFAELGYGVTYFTLGVTFKF